MRFTPKLLAVENDARLADAFEGVVAASGGTTRTVGMNHWSAELVQKEKFDAVLLGGRLRRSEALKIAEQIRFSETNSRSPIILVTSEVPEEALDLYTRAGVKFFLPRLATHEQIEKVLAAALSLSLRQRSRSERVPVAAPVIVLWQLGCAQQRTQGHLQNLSTTGVMARLDTCPPPQARLELWFQLPGEERPAPLQARMVRLEPGMRVGLRFVELTSQQEWRLENFVTRSLAASIQIPVLTPATNGYWFPTFRRLAQLFAW